MYIILVINTKVFNRFQKITYVQLINHQMGTLRVFKHCIGNIMCDLFDKIQTIVTKIYNSYSDKT